MPIDTRGIDHLIVLVKDMDRAVEKYRRMGFNLTPRMYHPFGSANNLMMFGSTFLEILGIVKPEEVQGIGELLQKLLNQREGVSHFALLSTDAEADHAEFLEKGLNPGDVSGFRRAVELPDGRELDAVVSVCTFGDWDSRVNLFVSQQHVSEAIWVPEWQTQPNGSEEIESLTIISEHPKVEFERLFSELFEANSIAVREDEVKATTPNGTIVAVTPERFQREFENANMAVETDRPYIAATAIRVKSLSRLEEILDANDVPFRRLARGSLLVEPEQACGIAIEFRA